jgi:hypothetical protein
MYTGIIVFGSIFVAGLITVWFVFRRMNRTEENRWVNPITKVGSRKRAHIK